MRSLLCWVPIIWPTKIYLQTLHTTHTDSLIDDQLSVSHTEDSRPIRHNGAMVLQPLANDLSPI